MHLSALISPFNFHSCINLLRSYPTQAVATMISTSLACNFHLKLIAWATFRVTEPEETGTINRQGKIQIQFIMYCTINVILCAEASRELKLQLKKSMSLWERKLQQMEGTLKPWLMVTPIPCLSHQYHEWMNIQLIWMVFIKSQELNSMHKMTLHWVSETETQCLIDEFC